MIVTNASDETKNKEDILSGWKQAQEDGNGYCSEVNCINKASHRVLVKQKTAQGESKFVIALCKEHYESFQDQIELDDHAEIVPAEVG